ncbi:MAG: TetR/AcrR family transcriptional regulator [Ardenticatenaceae bacterium]|nr:TetR/AcrR family transcriptional regulator [Ardenticatenaceae bacterium]
MKNQIFEPSPPTAGRPRSKRSHEAVIAAANSLLEEISYSDLTVERIASVSGVSKRTIYRWWPNKAAIVMEAASETDVLEPDTGQLKSDLVQLLSGIFAVVEEHRPAQAIRGLLSEAQFDEAFADVFRGYIAQRRQLCLNILKRAEARGELRPGVDHEVVADLIYGAYWNRFLIGHAPLSDAYATDVVNMLLTGIHIDE